MIEPIEQAVFTSAETDRSAGYQVVATSPGVSEADARQLAVWGPSHNALLNPSPNAVSYNFHPLPSGSHAISRTTPAGWEYSGRGGARVYTQCLIVPPGALARFANNPFALLRAALAAGLLQLYDKVPARLEPLRLAGRAAVVDSALLARLAANPGPDWMASLVQAALTCATVAVAGGPPAEHLIAGLINCLPPECRLEFSFSTGLKFASRRPFRVVALSDDREEQLRVQRLYDVAVLDFSRSTPPEFTPVESWPRFIRRALKSGKTSLLVHGLSRRQCEFAPEDLPALGLQLLEELDASSLADNASDDDGVACSHDAQRRVSMLTTSTCRPAAAPPDGMPPSQVPQEDQTLGRRRCEHRSAGDPGLVPDDGFSRPIQDDMPAREAPAQPEVLQRAHEAHRSFHDGGSPPPAEKKAAAPSQGLDPDDSAVLEKLEHLDDLVYDAIKGKPDAMDHLKAFWPRVRDDLGDELLAESQEQYLRYALSTWVESINAENIRDPARAVQSLEVLCVLFDET